MAEQAVVEPTRTDTLELYTNRSERPPETEVVSLDARRRVRQALKESDAHSYLPMQLIEKYANVAVRRADLKQIGGGEWFASITNFPGVWASESSAQRTLEVLEEVVQDWTLLKIEHKDRDLPVVEEINLNGL